MSGWTYTARLVPIGAPASVRGDHGQPVTFTFHEFDFSVTRSILDNRGDIPVLLNHNPDLRVGTLRALRACGTWWQADFDVDDNLDIAFERGQNVSVGLTWFLDKNEPRVNEISVVHRGRIPLYSGQAEVVAARVGSWTTSSLIPSGS